METQKSLGIQSKSIVKIKEPSMYNVIMFNDDFTTMEFVVYVLMKYFDKNKTDATEIMLTIHNQKKAIVGKYVYDVAVTKTCKVMQEAKDKGYPLKVVVDKDEK